MKKLPSILIHSIGAACLLSISAQGEPIFGLGAGGVSIRRFDSANPAAVGAPIPITGLIGGDTLRGIDFRPATTQLYGVGSGSRLYTISLAGGTAVATQVGVNGSFVLSGANFGVDFNPVPDRLRVVSDLDQNIRLNPNNGTLAATDTTLAYAAGDANAAANPNIVASAYTNNQPLAGSTTLYGIDSNLDILVIQNPPNNGILTTVGALGTNVGTFSGLDISGLSTAAFLYNGTANIYTVNLTTGAATLVPGVLPVFLEDIAALPLTPFYWDANPAAAGLGGSANWSLADSNWTFDSVGTGPNFPWPNTALSDAIFAGISGVVTLTSPSLQVRNVTFSVSDYTINGAQSLALVPGGVITVTNAGDAAAIEVEIAGAGALVKAGAGSLVLGGTVGNSYTGGTFVNNGVLLANRPINGDNTIRGPVIVIGDSLGAANSAELHLNVSFQVEDISNVTINPDGLLSVNNSSNDDFESLTMNLGNVAIGAGSSLRIRADSTVVALTMNGGTIVGPGTLTLSGDVVTTALAPSKITSIVNLDLGTRTFTVADGGAATDLLISGPIVTGTGLIKNGAGLMQLTGASTYGGTSVINGGSFIVDGSIASAVTVNALGLLGGHGVIGGNVLNGGIVSPGNSPGTLTVKGSYTQTSAGTLLIEVAGKKAGQFDVLAVNGAAHLDGTVRILNTGHVRLKRGQSLAFLTAGGGVNGKFKTEDISGFAPGGTLLRAKVAYKSNRVELTSKLGSFSNNLGELTLNQKAVAGQLDDAGKRNKANRLLDFLSTKQLSNLPGDLDKIAPEELVSIYNLGVSLANVQTANLERRMGDLQAGSAGFSASGYAMGGSGPSYSGGAGYGARGPEGKGGKELRAPDDPRVGVFLTGVGEFTDLGNTNNARGYDLTTGGFTLGVDYKVTPNFALGINAGYARSNADLTGQGRLTVDGAKLGLYATYFTGTGFYADVAVNGGYNNYDTRRSALKGTARGSTKGGELNALFATGYDFKTGGLSIGPVASVQYTNIGITKFREHGSLAPVQFKDQFAESLRTALGLKMSYDIQAGGVVIRPEARASWQHEFGDGSYALDSRLANGAGKNFTVRGPDIGDDSLLVGGGVAVLWNERTSTYVYYDGEVFRSNYSSNNLSGGLRLSF